MKFLKILLLIILSLFMVLFSILFMANLALERTVLNFDHYKNVTEEFNLFTQIHENVEAELIPEEVDPDEMQEEEKAMFDVLREVFEPQWLQEQTLIVLEDVLTYTKGETEELTATIDFSDRKVILEEKIAETIVAQEGLPLQEAQEAAEDIAKDIELPEDIVLSEMIPEEAQGVLDIVILVRTYSVVVSIAVLAFLLILMLLLGGFTGGLKWFGTSMLIPGIVLLIALIGFNSTLTIGFARNFVDIPTGFTFAIDVLKYTLRQMLVIPLVYSSTGLILIILGAVLGKKKKNSNKVEPVKTNDTDTTEKKEEKKVEKKTQVVTKTPNKQQKDEASVKSKANTTQKIK